MSITVVGRIVDAGGTPVTGRNIVLQSLGSAGWTTLQGLDEGEIKLDLPDAGPGRAPSIPVPLRLLDQSTQTPLVVSSDPLWSAERTHLVADFGTLRLLEEPMLRRGIVLTGENIIGAPLEWRPADDVNGPPREDPVLRRQLEASRAELEDVRVELSSALARVHELTSTLGTPTPVVEVIAGLGIQLSETNTQLATQSTPFRLAGVKLDLRGRFGSDGTTIVMDGAPDGSGISADLVLDAPSPAVPTQAVPSVHGLTAAAAARVLRSVGHPMDSATQQLGPGQGVPGQAITQHPASGAMVEFGSTVLVVFGVRNESDA